MVYICVCKCMYILAMHVWKDPSGYQRMAPDVASFFQFCLRQGLLHRPGQPAAKNSPSTPSHRTAGITDGNATVPSFSWVLRIQAQVLLFVQ